MPWEELDREEELLAKNDVLAMHGYGADEQARGWYGGKVTFRGSLVVLDGTPRIKLEEPELGPSRNLTRRFGSRNVFRLRLPKADSRWDNLVFDFVCRPLLLCDRVYRAFYAKDMTVFFISTSETVFDRRLWPAGGAGVMPFLDFIRWANPPELNGDQVSIVSHRPTMAID